MRWLLLGAVMGAALMWGGLTFGRSPGTRFVASFLYTAIPLKRDQLGCRAVARVHLAAVRPAGTTDPTGTVEIDAARGTDTLAIRIDTARNRLLLITGADVRTGLRTEGEPIPIIRNDDRVIVAAQSSPGDAEVYVFRLDKETGNAVWAKVGELFLGSAVAWMHYMEYR